MWLMELTEGVIIVIIIILCIILNADVYYSWASCQ